MGKKRHHAHAGRSAQHLDDEDEVQMRSEPRAAEAAPETINTVISPEKNAAEADAVPPISASPPSRTSEDVERRASGEMPGETPADSAAVTKKVEPSASAELIQGGGSSGVSTVDEVPLVPSGETSPLPLPPADIEPAAESTAPLAAAPLAEPAASDSEVEEEEAFRESLTKPPVEEPSALAEITHVLVFRISVAFVALAIRAFRYVVSRPLIAKGRDKVTGHASFPTVRDTAVRYGKLGLARVRPLLERAERVAPKQIAVAVEFSKDVYEEAVRMLQAAQPENSAK